MKAHIGWWIGGLIALYGGLAAPRLRAAQTPTAAPAPLIQHTFAEDPGGWTAIGQSGKVSVTHEADRVKEGKGALQFDYAVAKGELNALVLPTPDGVLTKMKSLRFWVRADHAAPLVVALQEKGGGRYNAMFTVPKDQWQQIELTPADFVLGVGADDPKDPDNRLDLDQVETVAIVDFSQLFAQSEDANIATIFPIQKGAHMLLLHQFVVSAEPLKEDSTATKGETPLDTFTRPQVGWVALGGAKLSRASGKPLDGSGLRADYRQAPGKIGGLVRPIQKGKLTDAKALRFTVASAKPTTLLVQVEEVGGNKFKAMVEVPGESLPKEIGIPFADFEPADDSKDKTAHLDLGQVYQLVIIDVAGFLGMVDQDNTLRLNKLHVTSAK